MKKITIYFFALLFLGLFSACSEDKLGDSIFDTTSPNRTEFDKWLLKYYVDPYNIDVKYRMVDIETNTDYTLVPADLEKAQLMSKVVKYGWIDAYDKIAGSMFTKSIVPKVLFFIGSPGYNATGSYVAGTAEGGKKITLYNINALRIPLNPDQINDDYFHVSHHEFAHILHQTKNYDPDFEKISDGKYVGSEWVQDPYNKDAYARQRGFVTPYAQSDKNEDFVETYSIYLTFSDARWNALLTQAGTAGAPIILEKLSYVRSYMDNIWGIDLEELKAEVQKRSNELPTIDFDNIYK